MEIFQVVGIGLIGALLATVLKVKKENEVMALLVSLMTGGLLFLYAIFKIGAVVSVLSRLADLAGINLIYLTTVLKIMGIAYVAEFGAQVCRDAGEGATASKIEFAAKVLVMVLALPIIVAIMESVLRLIP